MPSADAIHGVHARQPVVAGGLAPFGFRPATVASPFEFMRELLCLSAGETPSPTATTRITSTSGRPPVHVRGADAAREPSDDVVPCDLRRCADLEAASRAGRPVSLAGKGSFLGDRV